MKIRIRIDHILLFFILLTGSCSYYIKLLNSDKKVFLLKGEKKETFCDEKFDHDIVLLGSNKKAIQDFSNFLKDNKVKDKLGLIEKAVLWSLLQMNIRPNIVSPSSRLQLFISFNNRKRFFDFTVIPRMWKKSGDHYPFLFGLEELLKYYKSSYTLLQMANFLDRHYNKVVLVDRPLEIFLKKRQGELNNTPVLKEIYLKADQPLRNKESLPRLSFKKIIKKYLKTKKQKGPQFNNGYQSIQHLFDYQAKDNYPHSDKIKIKCNIDMKLYDKSIYLFSKDQIENHAFAINDNKNNYFLATASQIVGKLKAFEKTFLIQGSVPPLGPIFCHYENDILKGTGAFFSIKDRDPGQYLYYLLQYRLFEAYSIRRMSYYVNFPRHLFLPNPPRIIFESNRATPEHLQYFLSKNIPIYYGKSLGSVFGYVHFHNIDKGSLIIDLRDNSVLSCFKEL